VNAANLITTDLERTRRKKRANFVPALILVLLTAVGTLLIAGVRSDLLTQPLAALGVQALLWALCLWIFPAIGVGLLFPKRWARAGLILAAIVGAFVSATGWPLGDGRLAHARPGDACLGLILGAGALLIGISWVSGAFVQRRNVCATFWISAGLVLMAFNLVTCHCPHTGLLHVVPSHIGGALTLLAVGVTVGLVLRRTSCPGRSLDRSL